MSLLQCVAPSLEIQYEIKFCCASNLQTNNVAVADKSACDADAWLLLKSMQLPKQNLKLATYIKITNTGVIMETLNLD